MAMLPTNDMVRRPAWDSSTNLAIGANGLRERSDAEGSVLPFDLSSLLAFAEELVFGKLRRFAYDDIRVGKF
jgi:hypothetical protein